MKTTVEIVRGKVLNEGILSEHEWKLYKATGNSILSPQVTLTGKIRELTAKGYMLFVRPNIVAQFKYVAALSNRTNVRYRDTVQRDGKNVYYAGDIPDNALDNVIQALKDFERLTIHSNSPFPIVKTAIPKTDPVVIGWNNYISIQLKRNYRIEQIENDNTFGIIVAMWDMDKELM